MASRNTSFAGLPLTLTAKPQRLGGRQAILSGAGHNLWKILAHLRTLLHLLAGAVRKPVSALIAFLELQDGPRALPASA